MHLGFLNLRPTDHEVPIRQVELILTRFRRDVVQKAVPLMQNLSQMVQSAVVEMEYLVLRLPRSNNQLTGSTVVVVEEEAKRSHLAQINGKMATLHYRFLAIGRRRITAIRKL